MKRGVLGCLMGCLCGTVGNPGAMAQQTISLDDVVRSTQKQHPLIIEAIEKARAAEGRALGGLGIFDPTIEAKGDVYPHGDYQIGKGSVKVKQNTGLWGLSLFGGWRIGWGDYPVYKKESETSPGGQAQLGLELPILRGGPIDSGRAKLWASRYKRDAMKFRIKLTRLALVQKAAHRYWSWVAAGRRLTIATKLLQIAKTRMVQISGRVKRGDIPKIEEIDNQRAILKREGAVIRARRAFENAALNLSLFLRNPQGQPTIAHASQLPPSIPSLERIPQGAQIAQDIRHALSNRPEIKALRAERGATDVDRKLAKNAQLPTVNLSASGGYDIGSRPFETRRSEVLLGLTFQFPTLIRAARGALQSAQGKLGAIDAKLRMIADKVLTQVRDAYSALKAAKQSLEIAQKELGVAHQVEAAEQERFRLGASTLLTVNLREQAAAEAEVRAVDAAASLQRAMADYRAVTVREYR